MLSRCPLSVLVLWSPLPASTTCDNNLPAPLNEHADRRNITHAAAGDDSHGWRAEDSHPPTLVIKEEAFIQSGAGARQTYCPLSIECQQQTSGAGWAQGRAAATEPAGWAGSGQLNARGSANRNNRFGELRCITPFVDDQWRPLMATEVPHPLQCRRPAPAAGDFCQQKTDRSSQILMRLFGDRLYIAGARRGERNSANR